MLKLDECDITTRSYEERRKGLQSADTECDEEKNAMTGHRLNGWKSIARHLGRSERTLQSWESERALPVHRIPGLKGWTVYAYIEELDAWMDGRGDAIEAAPSLDDEPTSRAFAGRKPGLLVLPFERPGDAVDAGRADGYAQELIARFASLHPALRVLSWTTSKHQRDRGGSVEGLSEQFGVRYLIEGSIHDTPQCRRVDLRIVDAELDQVLLAHRFSSSRVDEASFRTLVVHGIVEHFDLIRAGALVEPLDPNEIDPECYIHYLEGVRYFAEGDSDGLCRAGLALDRATIADGGFLPARAMRALVSLQEAAIGQVVLSHALASARSVSDACRRAPSARVTAAFLDAAIAVAFDGDPAAAELQLSRAVLAMPASVALRGRLYERRSTRRDARRPDERRGTAEGGRARDGESGFPALDDLLRRQPQNLFANVMRALAGLSPHERRERHRQTATPAATGGPCGEGSRNPAGRFARSRAGALSSIGRTAVDPDDR